MFHRNFSGTLRALILATAVAALGVTGCKPKPKEITSLQRKEAEQLVSEAQFAITLRDYTKAESELAKAVAICPDTGDYWVSLGTMRLKLRQRDAAKAAYQSGLAAYEASAVLAPKDVQPVLQQITVLAMLGRTDEARALVEKLTARFPDNRDARMFGERKQLDRMLADPDFKEIAL